MVRFENLFDNKNLLEIAKLGNVRVLEHQQDLSVSHATAVNEYHASIMGCRRRQVLIELKGDAYILSAGAMQWTSGSVKMVADVKSVGDMIGKVMSAAVTKESAIKPKYSGTGYLMLEPTYKFLLLEEVGDWGSMVLEDGLFKACDAKVTQQIVSRDNVSSAFLGREGLFNLCLSGKGVAVIESPVPRGELITIILENDEIRIDGNHAIAWSKSLRFTVEKASKSFVGSAVSGEGFVNVYSGTGRVLMAPV